jgi:hypothetical protein
MIVSPAELWKCLCSNAGLELKLSKGKPGRDADMEDALRVALNVPDNAPSFEVWLNDDALLPNPTVSTETLLIEVIKSQSGFAQMMQDILDVLIDANAVHASNQLSVEFKFDEVNDPIKATLEQFRETVKRTKSIVEKRPKLPSSSQMCELAGVLRKYRQDKNSSSQRQTDDFPAIAPVNKTGNLNVDIKLDTIVDLVFGTIELWRQYGETPSLLRQNLYGDKNSFASELFSQLNAFSDYWDINVLESVKELSEQISSGKQDAEEVCTTLNTVLSKIQWSHIWVEKTFEDLLDILNLPAWKRRHELYSVWIGTRVLAVTRSVVPDMRFHLVDDVLSFAFGGSRLATYNWNNKQYDIWAELRSALVGQSAKRKKAIQPDFRVLQVELSKSSDSQTIYVLECKHYLNANKKNFTQAAIDYARSCPQAKVHLVNHGPADEQALSESLPPELQARTSFIGVATPLRELSERVVSNSIRNVLFPGEHPSSTPTRDESDQTSMNFVEVFDANSRGYIELDWDDTLADMDLSLQIISLSGQVLGVVDFRNKGFLDVAPFARFDSDVRSGPGKERIDISRWSSDCYRVIVTNYSEAGVMAPSSLSCKIVVGAEQVLMNFPSTQSGTSREWQVAEIVVYNGSAKVKAL